MRNNILFLACLLLQLTSWGQIVINEYSASNYNSSTDNYGEYEDWMELYNQGGVAVDLNGYYLSDKAGNLTKFQINSAINIDAGGYLMVYASGTGVVNANNIHTDFKITQTKGNEWWILTDPDGVTVVDSIFVRPALVNDSRGRITDGDASWGVFNDPTPANPNNNALTEYATTPIFSENPGFHPAAINLSITSPDPNVDIYYTTDGSHPDDTDNLYNGPIAVNNTTVIKAVAYSTDPLIHRSFIEYGTFLINTIHTVPILSISGGQVDNLLNGNGGIEPWGSVEYFKEGILIDKARGEFNEHGNDSWAYAQRGFDYITRDQFGYNHAIRDEIFRTKERDSYQRLIIKAAANDNYPFAYGSSGAHIRDAYVQSLSQIADLRMDERSYEPCVLFLNGEYWGLYEIREKVDDLDFTDHYYNQDSVAFLKTWGNTWVDVLTNFQNPNDVEDSWDDFYNFVMSNDVTDPAIYEQIKDIYNTGSIIDYFILNTYVVNADWLNWNTAWWRGLDINEDKRKWRYVLWDMDNTFDHGANYTGVPDQDADADPCDPENIGDPGGQGHVPIWNELLNNEEFFADYINRFADLSNSYFSCDFLISHLDSLIGIIEPEMQQQIDVWGGTYGEWEDNVQDVRDFILERCEFINSGIVDCYDVDGPYTITIIINGEGTVELSSIDITTDMIPWTGEYFGGVEFPLTANGDGFSFWEVIADSPYNFDPNAESISLDLVSDVTIIANFNSTSITYLVDPPNSGTIFLDGIEITTFPSVQGYTNNPNFTISANPGQQWQFDYWESLNHNLQPNANSETANFDAITSDTITLHLREANEIVYQVIPPTAGGMIVNGASIPGSPYTVWYDDDENLVLESNPNMHWEVDNWSTYNHFLNPNNLEDIVNTNINSDDTITLHYKPIDYPITLTTNPLNSGRMLLNDDTLSVFPTTQTFTFEDQIEIEAVESVKWDFNRWSSNIHAINIYSLLNDIDIIGTDTINLHFDEIIFHDVEISVEPENGGTVYINNVEAPYLPYSNSYAENTYLQLTADEAIGFKFLNWRTNTLAPLPGNEDLFVSISITEQDRIVAVFEEIMDVYIPNAFTPNSDFSNSTFKVVLNGINDFDFNLKIHDRWGEVLYMSNNVTDEWDGTHQRTGKPAPMGVYSYVANLTSKTTGKNVTKRGHITIIR